MAPDLDHWLPAPSLTVTHHRASSAPPETLWEAAREVRIQDTRLLGRLVRWRIPGVRAEGTYNQLFRNPPFMVLCESEEQALISGVVGRIWTIRRDYPRLEDPEEFREWSTSGTARVLFATWVQPLPSGGGNLFSEVRVEVFGMQGRIGLRAVRPLIRASHQLVGSDGIAAAVRRAESNIQNHDRR